MGAFYLKPESAAVTFTEKMMILLYWQLF